MKILARSMVLTKITKNRVKKVRLRKKPKVKKQIFLLSRLGVFLSVSVFCSEGDIVDETETNLIALRRTIYLTIQSSLDHNECAHKMMKMQMKPGQETELCHMILDCCTQQRTYEKFFGLLAQVLQHKFVRNVFGL